MEAPWKGAWRRINYDVGSYLCTRLRYEVPQTNWAYGVGFEVERVAQEFTLDQIRGQASNPGFGFAFVEHKDLLGMTGRIVVGNTLNQRDKSRRQFFETNRLGRLLSYEEADRKFGPHFTIELEASF